MPFVKTINPFFTDERGEMRHLLPDNVNVNSAVLIQCNKGSVRANHYHKKDGHYSYVLEGEMEYFYKKSEKDKLKKKIVKKGMLVYSPPGEFHAMKFPVKSIFIALATEVRDPKSYEEDTVRVKLI